jgi:polygalacturonase
MRNPRMWTDVYSECSYLTLDHLNIIAPRGYCQNLDGMDVCDSDHVTISNCHIEAQDDGICLKSHGPRGLQDISVVNNTITDFDANGIKIGTYTKGPIEGISMINNTVDGAAYGGLCIESVYGSKVSGVHVNGLEMSRVAQPIFIRLARRDLPKNGLPGTAPGSMDQVVIENVRVVDPAKRKAPSNTITGIPEAKLGSIVIRNAYVQMPGGLENIPNVSGEHDGGYPQSSIFGDPPAFGFYVRHAPQVTLDHVTVVSLKPDARPWLASDDATVNTVGCPPVTAGLH